MASEGGKWHTQEQGHLFKQTVTLAHAAQHPSSNGKHPELQKNVGGGTSVGRSK